MIYAYRLAWEDPYSTEAQAYQKAVDFLPQSNEAIYIAFPWTELIDSLEIKSQSAIDLLKELAFIKKQLPDNKRIVTVCESPKLGQYYNLFNDLKITDIFWSHAVIGEKKLSDSYMNLWPFPLYPTPTDIINTCLNSTLIKGQFSLCISDLTFSIAHLWHCVDKGIIPIITNSSHHLPGNNHLWKDATVFITPAKNAVEIASYECGIIAENTVQLKRKLHALNQIKKCYGSEFMIYDIVKFFLNPDDFILSENGEVFPAKMEDFLNIETSHAEYYLMSFVSALMIDRQEAVTLIDNNKKCRYLLNTALKNISKDRKDFYNRVFNYYHLSLD
jgi:hypothetical protein